MAKKNIKRQKRALKSRSKIQLSENNRLTVFRSNAHIYAQVSLVMDQILLQVHRPQKDLLNLQIMEIQRQHLKLEN